MLTVSEGMKLQTQDIQLYLAKTFLLLHRKLLFSLGVARS